MPSKDKAQKDRNYRLANPEKILAYKRAYRDKNRDEMNRKRREKRQKEKNNNLPQLGTIRVATGGRDYELEEAFTLAEIRSFRNE